MLIIDEPELSLHPLAQRKLAEMLAERAKMQQVIICTHSPYFVSWQYLKNGATLNRITKYDDIKSEIFTLNGVDRYSNLINGGNWQQPFLMDPIAREIFFYDNVLFVEGQTDAGLLRYSKDLDESINIFGYGIRGKGASFAAFQLAIDLGIRRSVVLLDGDADPEEVKELQKFNNYKCVIWDRLDIHDKLGSFKMRKDGGPDLSEKGRREPKVGYFTRRGRKKPSADLGDYQEKIDIINNYFKA